jgi:hypothetical protein
MTSFFLTSLTHPRKIILVVLQVGKAKELSSRLRKYTVEVYTENEGLFWYQVDCCMQYIPPKRQGAPLQTECRCNVSDI